MLVHGSSVWPLIYLSICVSHRTSCISITASRLVTVFAQWLLILLSQHNWVEAPRCFTAHQNPRLESVIDGFTCAHTIADKHTHTLTLRGKNKKRNQFTLLFISHIRAPRGPDRTLTYVETTNVYSCTPTHTHSDTLICPCAHSH